MFFKKNKSKKGFTLIELLVVMIISTIMMAAIVVQSRKWNNRLSLNTQTYEFMLAIRQAQFYSLGVKEFPGSSAADKFDIGYGVYVPNAGLLLTDPNLGYTVFADINGNGVYEYGGASPPERVEFTHFARGVRPKLVCYGEPIYCPDTPYTRIREVHISFLRPSPGARAVLKRRDVSGYNVVVPTQWPVYVKFGLDYIFGDNMSSTTVKIESNGQVSILQ